MARVLDHPTVAALESLEPRRLFTVLAGPVAPGEPQLNELPRASIEWANQLPAWFLDCVTSEKLLWNGKVIDTMYLPLIEVLEKRALLAGAGTPQTGLGSGLLATYYDNVDFTGPVVARVDGSVDFNWADGAAVKGFGNDTFSARWSGYVQPRYTETYTFSTTSDDGVRLWINDQLLIDNFTPHASTTNTATIALKANNKYAIRMEYFDKAGNAIAQLKWSSPSQSLEAVPQGCLFPSQGPYRGTAFTVGQQIEAEDFDHGGEGVAYSDSDVASDLSRYRNAGVDIGKDAGGGYYVGNTKPGEWLEYTVNVAKSGTYNLHLRAASGAAGGVVHLKSDGRDQTGPIPIPNTGGDQTYTTINTQGIYLSAGTHVLRLSLDTAGGAGIVGNINWLKLVPSTLTVLPPGSGFTGATAQPPAVGDASLPGYDAKAIARWDVVPYQTFDGLFNVGVVAFHREGIDRVEFSVNGGEWQAVREMTLNPETKVVEYWATLNARNFADGAVEIRAIAYPKVGLPRVLQGSTVIDNGEYSLVLHGNANHTLTQAARYVSVSGSDTTGDGSKVNPFATISKAASSIQIAQGSVDGGTVYLEAGDYKYESLYAQIPTSTAGGRWLTLTPAEGVARDAVRLVDGASPGLWRTNVRILGLTLAPQFGQTILTNNGGSTWVDQSVYIGQGGNQTHLTASGQTKQYWTDTRISDVQVAFRFVELVRGCRAENLGEDAFKFVNLTINCEVTGIQFALAGYHPDVWQYFGTAEVPFDNVIVYGLKAWNLNAQGVGPSHAKNLAFVNVDVDNTIDGVTPAVAQNFQGNGIMDHVLISRSRFVGKNTWRTDLELAAHNVVVELTEFLPGPMPAVPGITYR